MKKIIPSIPDFRDFVLRNNYFVDKTPFIKEWFDGNSYVALMPRPKRFGKTLNLSMIEHFFDIRRPENHDLFSEFAISKDVEFCEEHQNQYPVINISLKEVKDESWEACYEVLKTEISNLYRKHQYLLVSDKLDEFDKKDFEAIIDEHAQPAKMKYSLHFLSKLLYTHFNRKVIILVDEYDTPIISAFKNTNAPIKSKDKSKPTYYQKMVSFMQKFMGKAFKDNLYLERGLLTGVLRVSKESFFSTWNNVKVYDITSTYYSDKFGFTQSETEEILRHFNLSDRLPEVQKWYNGYKFGKTEQIYNPWSIVNYIASKDDGFRAYWVNSSDYSLIQDRITEPNVKQTIETLIAGGSIRKAIKGNIVFDNFETNRELVWTLLFHSGFLTQIESENNSFYTLRVPNNEVKIVFTDMILDWINNRYNITESSLSNTFNSLINNDLKEFEVGLKEIMQDSISYFDKTTNNRTKNEQIFHVYTLGLFAILSTDYIIKSNRESGEGRYDIMLIPREKWQKGIIVEIKSIEKQKDDEESNEFAKRINKEIDAALSQIEKRKYHKELIDSNINEEDIIKVPVVFAGKEPYISKLKIINDEKNNSQHT